MSTPVTFTFNVSAPTQEQLNAHLIRLLFEAGYSVSPPPKCNVVAREQGQDHRGVE